MRLAIYAMRIFTPTLTLPRQGGGDYKVVGQLVPSPLGGGVAIRHPGQVRPRRTRAGIQKNLIILTFHWIPDLAPRSGARPE
jgi:hypothetical protein